MASAHVPLWHPVRAVLAREFRSAVLNRYVQVFFPFALAGGFGTVHASDTPEAALFLVAQLALYFVSLFTLLVGVTAARAESEEWPILFAQPASRWTGPTGKLVAVCVIFAIVLVPLFGPLIYAGCDARQVARSYAATLALSAAFTSIGLAMGYIARDRAQSLLLAATVWVLLLFAFDLLALTAAHTEFLQKRPDLWVGSLMLNPLDSFRINAMFSMQQVPPEAAGKTAVAGWWLTHTGIWLATISALWSLACLCVANRAAARTEP